MAYICDHNPKTKKEFKTLASQKQLRVLDTNPFGGGASSGPGSFVIEGPRFPQPHKWYAKCQTDENGLIIPTSIK